MLHPLGKWGYPSCLPVGFLAAWHFLCRESKTWEELCGQTAGSSEIVLKFLLGNLFPRWNSYTLSFCTNLESVHVCADGFMNGFGRSGFPFSRMFQIQGIRYSGSLYLIFFFWEKNYSLGEEQKRNNVLCICFDHCHILCPSVILRQWHGSPSHLAHKNCTFEDQNYIPANI